MAMHPSSVGFGVTIMLHNSRVQSCNFLLVSIQTSFKGVRYYGTSLEAPMAKAHMMVLE
jgi:hypothetical protein